MKCKASELNKIIHQAAAVLPRITIQEVLKCFKFEGKKVQACSMESGVLYDLPGDLKFDKPVCVNGSRLASIVQNLSGDVVIDLTEKSMKIRDKSSSFLIPQFQGGTMPQFPVMPGKMVKAPRLLHAMKAVSPFTTEEHASKAFSGIHIMEHEAIATDNHCIAIAEFGDKTGLDVVVPKEAIKFLGVAEEVGSDASRVFFRSPGCEAYSGLIEAKFIDHRTHLPRWKPSVEHTVDRSAFQDMIPKLNAVARLEEFTKAKFEFKKDGRLVVKTALEGNSVSVEISVDTKTNASFEINVQLLDKWIKTVKGDKITVGTDEGPIGKKPVMFRGSITPDGQDPQVYTNYIMPMHEAES